MDIRTDFENSFKGKRITVMGLGLFGGGASVARFLIERGADVIVTDQKGEESLRDSLKALADLPITFHLGGHREEDFRDVDLVVVNPAVPKTSEYLRIARENDVPLDYEMNMFFRLNPAPIIGVTGSNGKSTVVSLIGEMLKAAGKRVWVGGNIGNSLLLRVNEISKNDLVALELSSFQLEDLQELGVSPHISVITNISANHLDRHGTLRNYIEIKKVAVKFQQPRDYAILNFDDPVLRSFVKECRGRSVLYSTKSELENGVFLRGGELLVRLSGPDGAERLLEARFPIGQASIPGDHNVSNIAAASAASFIAGAGEKDIESCLSSFSGLPHRIEFVREIGGVRYYNDSVATTPESAIAGLRAFKAPVILIAGGADKKLAFDDLAREVVSKAKSVILLGETAESMRRAIAAAGTMNADDFVAEAHSLSEAVHRAHEHAEPGDVVLLSPACASYGMFENYAERGNQFKALVNQLYEGSAEPGPREN